MTKFKQCFDEMLLQNSELFTRFQQIHDLYLQDPKIYQNEFNEIGREIQDVMRRYENLLCGHSEGSGFSKYSANLAEKFHQEVKKHFAKIDFIGVER
jgi:hypothetical protein